MDEETRLLKAANHLIAFVRAKNPMRTIESPYMRMLKAAAGPLEWSPPSPTGAASPPTFRPDLRTAAMALVADVRTRYPGERLKCHYMRELAEAVGMGDPPEEPKTVGEPIPMILHCPTCHEQHIDKAKEEWTNPPHRSHLCARCGAIWRPADVCTVGVEKISTAGKHDNVAQKDAHTWTPDWQPTLLEAVTQIGGVFDEFHARRLLGLGKVEIHGEDSRLLTPDRRIDRETLIEIPELMQELRVVPMARTGIDDDVPVEWYDEPPTILAAVKALKGIGSTGEARRLIMSNSVKVQGLADGTLIRRLADGDLVEIGKRRRFRVRITSQE